MACRPKQEFPRGTKAVDVLKGMDLSEKTFFITGANSGIGYETARALALHNAKVVIGCRSTERANAAVEKIKKEKADAKIEVLTIDNASLKSVEKCANEYKNKGWPLHGMILNAGVVNPPTPMTEDGIEGTFQINHLAHFYLTNLLMPVLIKSQPSRVVVVSSNTHRIASLALNRFDVTEARLSPKNVRGTVDIFMQYCNSKLCNILFSNGLDRRMKSKGVRSNCLHPGVVYTEIGRNFDATNWLFNLYPKMVYPEAGAATSVYCAAHHDVDNVGGKYYEFCNEDRPSRKSGSLELEQKLFDLSYELIERITHKSIERL